VSPLVRVDVLASHQEVEATQRRQRRQRGCRHLAGRWALCGGMPAEDDAASSGARAWSTQPAGERPGRRTDAHWHRTWNHKLAPAHHQQSMAERIQRTRRESPVLTWRQKLARLSRWRLINVSLPRRSWAWGGCRPAGDRAHLTGVAELRERL